MKKVFIVLLFILLGSALIVVSNTNKNVENSFKIVYQGNKNIALPDITNKIEIIPGLYRLYDENGLTLDFNIYNGSYNLNGITSDTDYPYIILYNVSNLKYYIKEYYISGQSSDISYPRASLRYPGDTNTDLTSQMLKNGYLINRNIQTIRLYSQIGVEYTNYTFKIQIEIGSHATDYVVPKLVPMYQDNLTMEEKQKIGLGAFGGITKIIKTINDIIKPVGDFINGLLSIF